MSTKSILAIMRKTFPEAKIELNFGNDFQLLIAVILSAQSTDKQVNKVTDTLFQTIQSHKDILNVGKDGFKNMIKSIGLYNSKGDNIYKLCDILEQNNGIIPNTLDKLTKLPGVGMKTAKIIMNVLFGGKYVAVDTHIHRVSNRLGIVETTNPQKTSELLEELIDSNDKIDAHIVMIFFGRYLCTAKSPKCDICPLKNNCEYYKNNLVLK